MGPVRMSTGCFRFRNSGDQNRLPRFRIKAHSAPIWLVAGWTGSLFEAGLEWHSKSSLEVEVSVDVVLVRGDEDEVDVVPRQRERSGRRGPAHRNLCHVSYRNHDRK